MSVLSSSSVSFVNVIRDPADRNPIDVIFSLFRDFGSNDYIGESVSQEQHMIQAALSSQTLSQSTSVIVASLLHDVGHLLHQLYPTQLMGEYGVKSHEHYGADYLDRLGFNEEVCDLVRNHVNAKRYLAKKKPGYSDELSQASRITLEYQGGFMTDEECRSFEKHERFNQYLAVRANDEAAKRTDLKEYPTLESYRPLMEACLKKSGSNKIIGK